MTRRIRKSRHPCAKNTGWQLCEERYICPYYGPKAAEECCFFKPKEVLEDRKTCQICGKPISNDRGILSGKDTCSWFCEHVKGSLSLRDKLREGSDV